MTGREVRRLFVGSYTDGRAGGIYTVAFDQAAETLQVEHEGGVAPNPSFVVQREQRLYAAHELDTDGCLAAYEVLGDGSLVFRGECIEAEEAGTCCVTVSPDERCLYGANYVSGSVMGCALDDEGSPCSALPAVRHCGSSVNKERQASAHVHSTSFIPETDLLAVVDLGIDEVTLYRTENCGALVQPAAGRIAVPPGSGPRMVAFRPGQRLAALVDELANNVLLFRFDASGLLWEPAGSLELTDASVRSERTVLAAHPAFSPDGRWLYVSVRGMDVIVVFELDDTGVVVGRSAHSSGGRGPRHFSLSPDGKLLAVANQDTNNVVVFAISAGTGALQKLATLTLPQPSCVMWGE